jgi:calcineurin-like phosphoesterase family protein
MRDIWFTSDFHFGHHNIIRYCNRPFANTQEMDAVIVSSVLVKTAPFFYDIEGFTKGALCLTQV